MDRSAVYAAIDDLLDSQGSGGVGLNGAALWEYNLVLHRARVSFERALSSGQVGAARFFLLHVAAAAVAGLHDHGLDGPGGADRD